MTLLVLVVVAVVVVLGMAVSVRDRAVRSMDSGGQCWVAN
jgi:hypothetical protein